MTPTVVLLVGTAAVWSVATDGLSTQNIDVYGSTPSARGFGCTGSRKKHSVVGSKTDAHFPNYGVHCHLCWAVIVTPPAPGLPDTLRIVLRSF